MIAYIKQLKATKQIIALVLALCMIFALSACKDDTGKTPAGNSSVGSSLSDNNSSSGDSQADDSADVQDNSSEQSAGNNVIGQAYNVTESINPARSDYYEKKTDETEANLYAPLKGYKDAEAEAMKEKILNTKNTEEYYGEKMTGTKYYISPGGNDENDGKSPETPFRTTDALSNLDLKAGDSVLFERNSIFRITSQINVREGVIYGSYGEGTKPQIYGAPYNFAGGDYWEPTKVKNVWKATYLYEEISCVVYDHGELVGNLRWDPVKLRENGDFYNAESDDSVYIYCDKGNPSKVFESIEISPARFVFKATNVSNYVIDNICIKYAGAFGVSSYGPNKNVYITNCEMGYIGGFSRNKSLRLGNAIEFGGGADNFIVENNWIYQTFDTAITWQGGAKSYKNMSFSNNLLEYNVCDIEFFSSGGCEVSNFKMDGNIMRFTSGGWGNRPNDAGARGIEGLLRGTTNGLIISDFIFTNNIIDCPVSMFFNWFNTYEQKSAFKCSGNSYYVKQSYRTTTTVLKDYIVAETDRQGAAYKATNADETKTVLSYIDPTAKLYWYE